jgi:hypothetical protein
MASGDSHAEFSAMHAPAESQARAFPASAQAAVSHTSNEPGPGDPLLAASISSQLGSDAGDWIVGCSVQIERRTPTAMQLEKARWRLPQGAPQAARLEQVIGSSGSESRASANNSLNCCSRRWGFDYVTCTRVTRGEGT